MSGQQYTKKLRELRLKNGAELSNYHYYDLLTTFNYVDSAFHTELFERISEKASQTTNPNDLIFICPQFENSHKTYQNTLIQSREGVSHEPSDIPCKKCKKNTIGIYRKQTRSGDEGETIYFNCWSCSYTWRG
jgi:DNA-directed RNA polymerase subunit M/transcription elongation factor TFIIS